MFNTIRILFTLASLDASEDPALCVEQSNGAKHALICDNRVVAIWDNTKAHARVFPKDGDIAVITANGNRWIVTYVGK